jgi:NADH dehydrogenase [ubiquinone] 1 alpha subcomplex assembly factor 5
MSDPTRIDVFDRAAVRRHRARAARAIGAHDFLFREAASRLGERLDDIRRAFPRALDLGGHGGVLAQTLAGRSGIETWVHTDVAEALARRGPAPCVVADEELLPFADASFDLIASALSLHWVNDLPGALIQLRRALRPDGLLLISLLGGETLHELRNALLEAEAEETGGAAPRVSPFADVRDAGSLLQRAGFALPVVDADTVTVSYPDALALMRDLRAMGEANALTERRRNFSRRGVLLGAAARYAERFAGPDGRVPATFKIVTLTAWAPHAAQPRPLRPGSAAARLAEALGTVEAPAGDRAKPR